MLSWLRAQISEHLAIAIAALGDGTWYETDGYLSDWENCRMSRVDEAHIVANSPRDTIARCEAELRELDRHEPNFADCCPLDDEVSPCESVQIMASGYRHRPGWSLSWSPDTTEGESG